MKQNRNKMKLLKYFIAAFILQIIMSSCSNTKYLPEGELLYVGGKVKVEDTLVSRGERKDLQKEQQLLIRPKPNSKILGLRFKLFFYNISGKPKKEKGFRHWVHTKLGEPPVLFSQVDLDYNSRLLQNHAENRGYFKSSATADSTRHGKRVTAEYLVNCGKQYTIKSIEFPNDSSAISKAINATQEKSLLKIGEAYNLEKIKSERERIDVLLKDKGFYYFGPDYLLIQVDSTVGNYQTKLIVKVKEETPKKAEKVFKIGKIIIYPNYSLKQNNRFLNKLKKDSTAVDNYHDFTIVDKDKLFHPRIFDRTLYFHKGDIYNRTAHNLSLNRLVNLGTFKFVKNQFTPSDSLGGNVLDAYYYLTPLKKKSIRVEVLGKTNSANYTGTELNVNWSNRNTFKGAELFTISAFGGLEFQMAGQNKGFDVFRVGTEANLIWPRFIAPFELHSSSGFVPKTKATIGYEFQKREQLYALNSFKFSFGYLWKENIRKEHALNVLNINYISPNSVTDLYRTQMSADPSLAKVIEKQLIFGPTYSYTYTNTMESARKHTVYFKGAIDAAGTITGLLTGADIKKQDTVKVLGVAFSQYIKLETDFRHYMKLGKDSQLASRIIVGAGYGYGNSKELPYIKQFFIAGTNSIRAFRARSIGPGSYLSDIPTTFLPDQSGDIKLEVNTEYRAKIVSIVKGAVFVDAGNIWLMNKNPDKVGSEFSNKFMQQIAVGTGVGLRFDLSFLLLRTDFSFPIRKPYLDDGKRWVIDQINFGSGSWRNENLIFNLAIGYPF